MFRPLGPRVVVKPETVKQEQTTASGIIRSKETVIGASNVTRAEVISVAKVVEDVKIGDMIFYESHGGHAITVQGEDLVVVSVNNILGVE